MPDFSNKMKAEILSGLSGILWCKYSSCTVRLRIVAFHVRLIFSLVWLNDMIVYKVFMFFIQKDITVVTVIVPGHF